MANLLLTTKCVRSCPYCFAKNEMSSYNQVDFVTWENIVYLADFLSLSNEKHISLLGGEPSLHPYFIDIILYFIERGFHVTVFTSGIMSEKVLHELDTYITTISKESLHFVCNLNNFEQTPTSDNELKKVFEFLQIAGPWTLPGFNIYRTDFKIDFIFEYIVRFGMKGQVRIGIANPIINQNNDYIHQKDIKEVISNLFSYKEFFEQLKIKPSLDCGFPMCYFSDEQIGWLFKMTGNLKFGCGIPIDITPSMEVYSCFPLSYISKKSLFEFNTLNEIRLFYANVLENIRQNIFGIFEDCHTCVHKSDGICLGGGICHMLRNQQDEY